jgi:hypothetical protein
MSTDRRDVHRHDALDALVRAIVDRWNAGRWTRATVSIDHSATDGSGMVTVERNGHRQAMRYHLPETVGDITEMVHALCEDPETWKSQHRRDYGAPA